MSSSVDHQKANLDIFDFSLTAEETKFIDSMDKGIEKRICNKFSWLGGYDVFA